MNLSQDSIVRYRTNGISSTSTTSTVWSCGIIVAVRPGIEYLSNFTSNCILTYVGT